MATHAAERSRTGEPVAVLPAQSALHRLSKLVPFAILFIGGFNAALPDYRWARPIQVFHGVFANDALLILYIAALPMVARSVVIAPNSRVVGFSALIAALGTCGVISAGVNGYSILDFGEAVKLYLFSGYLLLAVRWCQTHGETFVLRSYLTGVAAGGTINLYYTILEPEAVIFGIPVLWSPNGAGGTLGLAVGLGAWLMVYSRTRADARIALAVTFVGLAAASISCSRTSITMAVCGIAAWSCAIAGAMGLRRPRRRTLALATILMLTAGYVAQTDAGNETLQGVRDLARKKFIAIDFSDKYSVGARYMYFWGVLEILDADPIVGVAYSGFYDAITQTAANRSGQMADESSDPADRGAANPHNSFLYYTAANGVPGLVITLVLFVTFVQELFRARVRRGLSGVGLCACLSFAYFVYGNTLPTLYNTEVLYVAAAVAMGRAARLRAARARAAAHPAYPLSTASGASVTA